MTLTLIPFLFKQVMNAFRLKTLFPYFILLLCELSSLHLLGQKSQSDNPPPFFDQIKALQKGEIKHLKLAFDRNIELKQLLTEKIDERDFTRNPNGFIDANFFAPITSENICAIHHSFMVLVVEDRFKQLRALTVNLNGQPIECFLIYDTFIYTSTDFHEVEGRRYAPNKKFLYNPVKKQFTFSNIFKIYENTFEETPLDLAFHEDETSNKIILQINDSGQFISANPTQYKNNVIYLNSFNLTTSFINNTTTSIKQSLTSDSDTLIKVYLDRDQTLTILDTTSLAREKFYRLDSKIPHEFQIYQQQKISAGINGDGDFCTIDSLSMFTQWVPVGENSDIIYLHAPTAISGKDISITPSELNQAVRKYCGQYHLRIVKHINKSNISKFLFVNEIILKIVFIDPKSNKKHKRFISFVLSPSC